jgi:hypothetical protein
LLRLPLLIGVGETLGENASSQLQQIFHAFCRFESLIERQIFPDLPAPVCH